MVTTDPSQCSGGAASPGPGPRVPWITLFLVAANLAVHIAMSVSGADPSNERDLLAWGASHGPKTFAEPWRLLTANFVHFTTSHLVTNVLWIAVAGTALERLLGHARFGAVCLAACVGGELAGIAVHPQGAMAGASGLVLGMYGAMGAALLRSRDPLHPSLEDSLWLAGLGLLVYAGLFWVSSQPFDVATHVGGFAAGAAAGAWLAAAPNGRSGVGAAARVSLATVGVATAALVLLPEPIDLAPALDRFARTEARLASRATWLRVATQRGDTAAAMAVIREDLIPSWHELRTILPEPARLGPRQQALVALLNRYAAAQEEVWTLIAGGASTQEVEARATELRQLRLELDAHVVRR